MKWRERLFPHFLILAFAAGGLIAKEHPSSAEYHQAADALVCQCGCSSTLSTCAMEQCHSAEPLREEIAERLDKGESVAAILEVFKERYGLSVLSSPPKSGFHLTAWVTPFIALVIGFFIVAHVLRSWRRQTAPASGDAALPVSAAQRARIEKELRDLSS